MKTLLTSFLIVFLLASSSMAQTVRKVFIIAGQSNAMGYGNRIQLTPVPSWAQTSANGWEGHPTASADTATQYPHPTAINAPGLYNSNNTGLMSGVINAWGPYEGARPTSTTTYSEESSYGPEVSLLAQWRAANPGKPYAVVKCVLGGSSIENWLQSPEGSMWPILYTQITQAAARLNASGEAWEWAGMLWWQGESGASTAYPYLYPTPGAEYKDKLRAFLASVRSITRPGLPVAIMRIGNHMLAPAVIGTTDTGINTIANRIGATYYRRAQQEAVALDPYNGLVNTDDLPVLQSGDPAYWYHHTGAGYLAAGERAWAVLAPLMGIAPPPPPPPAVIEVFETGVLNPLLTGRVWLNGIEIIAKPGETLKIDVRAK